MSHVKASVKDVLILTELTMNKIELGRKELHEAWARRIQESNWFERCFIAGVFRFKITYEEALQIVDEDCWSPHHRSDHYQKTVCEDVVRLCKISCDGFVFIDSEQIKLIGA